MKRIATMVSPLRLALLATILLGCFTRADQTEFWPYERLKREADLVVIAEIEKVEDSGEIIPAPLWGMDFVGVNASFRVKEILRGRYKGEAFTLLHLRLPDGKILINGPQTVTFQTAPVRRPSKSGPAAKREYLLFLKARKDGRFEPASGILDPAYSVRELTSP